MRHVGRESLTKLCIVTGYRPDLEWNELADITTGTMREYCNRWNHSLRIYTGGFDTERALQWGKVLFVKDALPHYEWVFWIDADAAITNHTISVNRFIESNADILVCEDYPVRGFNTGVFFIRRCDFSFWLLDEMWKRTEWSNKGEQRALVDIHKEGKTKGRLMQFDGRDFNGFCEWDSEQFGKFPDENQQWHVGDFVAHCAGYAIKDRIRILKEAVGLSIR